MKGYLPEPDTQSPGALEVAHKSSFLVGGVSVQLSGNLQNDVALGPALLPFRFGGEIPDIRIQVERAEKFLPSSRDLLFDSGSVWRLYQAGDALQFDFSSSVLRRGPYKRLLVDNRFKHAMLSVSHTSFSDSPTVPVEYPLDELLIMHRLTQERAIELHGAGIIRPNGVANLFIGHSGAGKSTTTRLWTSYEDVEVLSDDRIIVRPDTVSVDDRVETQIRGADGADGIGILRLSDGSASRTHRSAQDDKGKRDLSRDDSTKPGPMRMYGTPWHGEAMFASPNSAPLTRIFILEHGHSNVITRLTRSQAVGELFARSFVPFHRHEYVDSALSFLEQLADSVPCYSYSFEPDERAVDKIIHFHD